MCALPRSIAISARRRISRRRSPNCRGEDEPRPHRRRAQMTAAATAPQPTRRRTCASWSLRWRSAAAGSAAPGPIRRSARWSSKDGVDRRPRLDPSPAAGRMPRPRRSSAPARPRAARRSTSRSSRARITARRRPAPTPSSAPASPAWSRRWRIPIRRSPGRATRGCARPASRSRSGSAPRRRGAPMPAISAACATAARRSLLKLAVSADGKAGARRPQAGRRSPARRRARACI